LVGGHDHHHHHGDAAPDSATTLYAAGHAEQEALARVLVGGTFFEHRLQPAIGLGTQQVIGSDNTAFVVARSQVRSQIGERFAISVDGEVPMSDARRFDWAAGLRFDLLL
jgi:hypothetical protein